MPPHTEQVFDLVDKQHRQVGQLTVERTEDQLIFGKFVPGPAFPSLEPLFRDFEEAVNLQALSRVDDLDAAIAALGLQLQSPDGLHVLSIHDVQIWSDGGITCRLGSPAQAKVNGSLVATQPGQPVQEGIGYFSQAKR